MNMVKKKEVEDLHLCLNDYISQCKAKEKVEFITFLTPMFFRENKHSLVIRVGKRLSDIAFQTYLTSPIKDFNVVLGKHEQTPILIFNGVRSHTTYMTINLDLVKDVIFKSINVNSTMSNCKISFNYNNEVDYELDFIIK